MFHASEFISPGIATIIANTQPLFSAMLATIFLKENLNSYGKAGLLLGFIGIIVIAFPSFSVTTNENYGLGIFYIILSAVGITVSNVLIRYLGNRIDALSAMGWQLIIGSLFLALLSAGMEDMGKITWNLPFIASLLGLALPGTALAYWLWCLVLKDVKLNHANAFSFLIPVFGLSIGVVFFKESIGPFEASGIGLAIFGIILVNWPNKATRSHKP